MSPTILDRDQVVAKYKELPWEEKETK